VYLNSPRTTEHYELLKSKTHNFPVIDDEFMTLLQSHSAVLDPMHRSGEFLTNTEDDRLAFYRQSEKALFARMSVLMNLLG